ncbi:TRAFAC clade GTPase domain-containing protein [Pedobacter frigidisoli]|uniref:TRAFAC clade GTPase domain-containing protein n=1 Tax=Pedobacter frigidisoli TaxID=2530455 RepID=UPI00292E25C2|nr:hypothetical protein [Pedobacter frigidisoli]
MEITNNQILLLGLPESGKTSFLAAFYHFIDSDVEDKPLSQARYSKNTTYLNYIVSKWLNCELIGRTAESTGASTKEVILHLVDNQKKIQFDLNMPDMAGESFVRQYTDRTWEQEYKVQAENSEGSILFINPSKVRAHVLIDEIAGVLQAFGDEPEDLAEQVDFNAEKSPSQVMLVDILAGHAETLFGKLQKIAIVISAWDEQMASHKSPAKWLEKNMPLLNQYLITNPELFQFKVFGISAQGGSISEAESVLSLRKVPEPAERIIVQEEDKTHKNICAPIEWIINEW